MAATFSVKNMLQSHQQKGCGDDQTANEEIRGRAIVEYDVSAGL